jgi:threonine dehydratase
LNIIIELFKISCTFANKLITIMLTLDKIYHASYVLKDVIRRTELIHAPNINKKCNIYLKPENLQLTGSFKVRGSYYKISQLSEEEKAKGVIACSAGNHAQGVALAATKNGIKSIICLPDGAPISKVEATKNYGADICLVEGVYDDAYKRAIELRDEHGYTFIHPFDDIDVIAGQGTIALELIEQKKDIDAVIVPIGGGGLISEDGWNWYPGAERPGGGAAPDALKIGDKYLVAYSSTGGGLGGGHAGRILTMWNKTLDPSSPDFKFT